MLIASRSINRQGNVVKVSRTGGVVQVADRHALVPARGRAPVAAGVADELVERTRVAVVLAGQAGAAVLDPPHVVVGRRPRIPTGSAGAGVRRTGRIATFRHCAATGQRRVQAPLGLHAHRRARPRVS